MADVAYHLAGECVCGDGSGRPCKSTVGHFVNHEFVPQEPAYSEALKRGTAYKDLWVDEHGNTVERIGF